MNPTPTFECAPDARPEIQSLARLLNEFTGVARGVNAAPVHRSRNPGLGDIVESLVIAEGHITKLEQVVEALIAALNTPDAQRCLWVAKEFLPHLPSSTAARLKQGCPHIQWNRL
jgi:hypothetical protein